MRLVLRLPQVLTGVAIASYAAVGAAVATQQLFDMLPCPWCVLQRLLFLTVGTLALAAAWLPRVLRLPLLGLAVAAAVGNLASALWQQFHASKSLSCDMTLADKIISGLQLDRLAPEVFMPMANCADATVNLLGLSYALWSALLTVISLAVLLSCLRFVARGGRRPRY